MLGIIIKHYLSCIFVSYLETVLIKLFFKLRKNTGITDKSFRGPL